MNRGFSLPELLVAVAVIGVLAGLSLNSGVEALARQRLEHASRKLLQGLERARAEAQRHGQPCGLALHADGWAPPVAASLPACLPSSSSWRGPLERGSVQLAHNLPSLLRFSSNGLLLDGGTLVLSTAGTPLKRCLVIGLPLGVVRLGRYTAEPAQLINSGACLPDARV